MKKLLLASMLLIAFLSSANGSYDGPGSGKTHKFEIKKGFNYKKHHRKHKRAKKHSSCRKVDFIH
jgi:hypothetical protein